VRFPSRHLFLYMTPIAPSPAKQHVAAPRQTTALCRNCGTTAPGKFCPACGQETALHPPSALEFVHEFITHYVALEGKLWRTLGILFFKPGKLTTEYLAGRKRRYVPPLRVYLTFSIVALFTISVVTKLNVPDAKVLEQAFNKEGKNTVVVGLGPARAQLKEGKFTCDNMPAFVCERLRSRFDVDNKSLAREITQISARMFSNLGIAMFALLPLFALWLKLLYRKRGMLYGEHLVFTLHLHAFWFAVLLLMVLLPEVVADPLALAIPLYAILAMRHVYGGRWSATLLRASALTALYVPCLIAAIVVLGLWAVIF
jgi:hypothetical protein